MNKIWLPHPTILRGFEVELHPLQENHLEELFAAASDAELWRLTPSDCSKREKFFEMYEAAIKALADGKEYPFVIVHKTSGKLIGSTRFFDIFPEHRKLEIGWTWITREFWGTAVNLECKLLLLKFCFETLKTIRVQLKTNEKNIRSRTAIEKIGGKFEGILRKDRIQDDGTLRNTAYFSILVEEWNDAKNKILTQLAEKSAFYGK